MSAQIIDLRAWRREHRSAEPTPVKIPVLVPTWPWGWLLPVLIEMTLEQ
jgi:hypothetical protein